MALKITSVIDQLELSKGKYICSYLPNNDIHALWQYGVWFAASVYVGCPSVNPYSKCPLYLISNYNLPYPLKGELLHFSTVTKSNAILCCSENLDTAEKVADELDSIKVVVHLYRIYILFH